MFPWIMPVIVTVETWSKAVGLDAGYIPASLRKNCYGGSMEVALAERLNFKPSPIRNQIKLFVVRRLACVPVVEASPRDLKVAAALLT
jgi:hypothetical protein